MGEGFLQLRAQIPANDNASLDLWGVERGLGKKTTWVKVQGDLWT